MSQVCGVLHLMDLQKQQQQQKAKTTTTRDTMLGGCWEMDGYDQKSIT